MPKVRKIKSVGIPKRYNNLLDNTEDSNTIPDSNNILVIIIFLSLNNLILYEGDLFLPRKH